MYNRRAIPTAIAAVSLMFAVSACSDASDDSSSSSTPSDSPSSSDGGDSGCYVQFFDSDDLDESDDNFKLTQPGDYEDLKSLPGADMDWTDEADSLEVGPGATVTVWSDTGFDGPSKKLEPGNKYPDVDPEPSSLKMSC